MRRARRSRPQAAPTVGLFGLFGQGNLGNDGSLESVLSFLRTSCPAAVVDVRCTRPDLITERYGIPAARYRFYSPGHARRHDPLAKGGRAARTMLGMAVDAVRTASWVRRHDAVIVPGMGVLEATLPQRPWQTPYLMFLLSASGQLFRTKVMLVSVGSNVIRQRATRALVASAARRAYYLSFRDSRAREAMQQMGPDVSGAPVYPDLAFALPLPADVPAGPGIVGVGIMEYSGGNDDRRQAAAIRARYVREMTRFVAWLAANGRPVRLLAGDTLDRPVVEKVQADVRKMLPDLDESAITAEPAYTLSELMTLLAGVETVVASRFHTVLCALRLEKPTLAVGYGVKFEELMAEMGLAGFLQQAKSVDADRLTEQFTELESRASQLRPAIAAQSGRNQILLDHQFGVLAEILFPAAEPSGLATRRKPTNTGVG